MHQRPRLNVCIAAEIAVEFTYDLVYKQLHYLLRLSISQHSVRWCASVFKFASFGPNVAAAEAAKKNETKKPTRTRTRNCAFSFHLLTITTSKEIQLRLKHAPILTFGKTLHGYELLPRCRRWKLKMNLNLLSLVFRSRYSLHVSSIL